MGEKSNKEMLAKVDNAAQAIWTNYVKHHTDMGIDNLWKMCGKRAERVQHIIKECWKLDKKKYERHHKNIAKWIHRKIFLKNALEHNERLFHHNLWVTENEGVKLLWDIMYNVTSYSRNDILLT